MDSESLTPGQYLTSNRYQPTAMLEVGAALHSHAQRCSLRVVPKLTQLQRRRSSGEVVGEGKGVFAACELRKASASLSAEHFRRTDTWYPSWSLKRRSGSPSSKDGIAAGSRGGSRPGCLCSLFGSRFAGPRRILFHLRMHRYQTTPGTRARRWEEPLPARALARVDISLYNAPLNSQGRAGGRRGQSLQVRRRVSAGTSPASAPEPDRPAHGARRARGSVATACQSAPLSTRASE